MEVVYGWKRAVCGGVIPRCCDCVLISACWPRSISVGRGQLAAEGPRRGRLRTLDRHLPLISKLISTQRLCG